MNRRLKGGRLCFLLMVSCLPGCADGCIASEEADRRRVDSQQKQYAIAQPIPYFEWSQERDTAIQLYKLRNEKVRTWTVWRSDYGMIEGDCESTGYPLPYDVQLTNPLARPSGASTVVVEQPEPNGLFSSKHTTATWIRSVVRHNGKVMEVPIYVEGKVTCYPYPVRVDYEKNRVVRVEAESPTVELKKKDDVSK
jgi:hypothetical protein